MAADILLEGGIVAYPTDTLYGLAVDPLQDAAVARLYEAKGRDAGIGIPLIASSLSQARKFGVFSRPDMVLARAFWPGPLTLVLRSRDRLSKRISSGGRTIAIRVPAHPVATSLADRLGSCITATSANRSGQPAAASADEVAATLSSAIDLLLDGGPAPGGPPSTIVEVGKDGPRLVRAGSIAWERVLRSLE